MPRLQFWPCVKPPANSVPESRVARTILEITAIKPAHNISISYLNSKILPGTHVKEYEIPDRR